MLARAVQLPGTSHSSKPSISQEAYVPGLTDNTLDEIDSHLRNLRRQLATLEAARRQLVGHDEAPSSSGDGRRESLRRAS